MDILKIDPPFQLPNERKEMFALIDRFEITIKEYKKEYAETVHKRDEEINDCFKEKEDALTKIKKTYLSTESTLKTNAQDSLNKILKYIGLAEDRYKQNVAKLRDDLSDFIDGEKKGLRKAFNEGEARLKEYRETRDSIERTWENVDTVLGTTIIGKRKLDRICEKLPGTLVKITDRSLALHATDKARRDEAEKLYDTISDITWSLPKRVIFNKKRSESIRQLRLLLEWAREGVKWLEQDNQKENAKRQRDSKGKVDKEKEITAQKEQQEKKNRDDTISKLKKTLSDLQAKYDGELKKEEQRHSAEYKKQSDHYDDQIKKTGGKWEKELENCDKRFAAKMEELYPAQRMNAWINQFWRHPADLETYNKISFPALNTLIGVAIVSISDWVDGDTGNMVRRTLTRYPLLFGRNREEATNNYNKAQLFLPYSLSIEEGESLLISYEDKQKERAETMVNAIGMRLLRSVPACQMRFQLFDPSGIKAFARLLSLDPAIDNNPNQPIVKSIAIGDNGKVHSENADITKQITETKIKMGDLSAQLIHYSSIREFNDQNPLSKQLYRPILMMNFPMGLGVNDLESMKSMTVDCSKWGFSMVLAQPDGVYKTAKPEIQEAVKELAKHVLHIRLESSTKAIKALHVSSKSTEKRATLGVFSIPNSDVMENIAKEIRVQSVEASRIFIDFIGARGIYPERENWFTQKADNGIVVPVGYLDGGQPFRIQFDDKHVHTLVMGNTGTGKTNLLHVLMMNLMLRYSPDEVKVYLIDFKYGSDFSMYASYNLPNFTTISVNTEPEFVLGMLQDLQKEMVHRSTIMGDSYHKIADYNMKNPGHKLNRIILIIDELYELAKQATDEVRTSILRLIDHFAHDGRAFGIHIIVCGQDLDRIDNFETINEQCATRLAFYCGDDKIIKLMGEAGQMRMHMIGGTDPGACVFSLAGGKDPQIERTAFLDVDPQKTLLKAIHEHYTGRKQITNVRILQTKVSNDPNHVFQKFVGRGVLEDIGNRLIIGEPMSMERELALAPTDNLWVAGGHTSEKAPDAGESILFYSALSLLLTKLKGKNLDIICTDCNNQPLRTAKEEEKDLVGQLTAKYNELFFYSTGNEIEDILNQLLSDLEKRINKEQTADRAVWWILSRPEIITGIGNNQMLITNLLDLLQKGPKYNIHTIVWNADPKRAQVLQIEKLFKDKVCLEMSPEDWKIVTGNEPKIAPRDFKALLISNNTIPFRVYDLPDGLWMNKLFDRLDHHNR